MRALGLFLFGERCGRWRQGPRDLVGILHYAIDTLSIALNRLGVEQRAGQADTRQRKRKGDAKDVAL